MSANHLIFYSLSCITTYYLSKGRQLMSRTSVLNISLLPSEGLTYTEVQEEFII